MEPIQPARMRQSLAPVAGGVVVLAATIAVLGSGTGTSGGGEGVGQAAGQGAAGAPEPAVRPGVSVLLSDSLHLVRGRRAGLITNQTGVGSGGVSSIDLLAEAPGVDLVALFSPEHGIRGDAAPGDAVAGGTDPVTGLPIHSLYGETRKPTPEMLEGLEVLLYDIQDTGARYYTYVSTMALAMEAAGEAGIPFVVLDRPNPIGGRAVQGNVLDTDHASFVGMYPVAMRHGMTPGELARLYAGEFGVEVELHVVPARGWRRGMWFDETGLPWIRPSPNLPDLISVALYPGTCLFEGTNLSVGRGTAVPFRQVGAPWLDAEALARRLNERRIPGVRFEPVTFVPRDPDDGKYADRRVHGVRFVVVDRDRLNPPRAAVAVLVEARRLAADRWKWHEAHFDRLAGGEELRRHVEKGVPAAEITGAWGEELRAFRELRNPYLLYP